MKMDIRHQDHKTQTEQTPYHFMPIVRHEDYPAPLSPPHHEHDDWNLSREVVPFYFDRNLPAPTTLDSERRQQHARALINRDIDVRFSSAREMSAASLELYVRGLLSWEEYARLAFQPELHPDYDATIGALLGVQAEPDKPQDYVRLWEERLAYERRYNKANPRQVRSTERITIMMRRLAGISSLRA